MIKPAKRLIINVDANLHIAKFQPSVETLKKNISGSIEGEASQKDITGARGTPLINKDAIIGITEHEQNGLNAPTNVAKIIETDDRFSNTLFIYFDVPVIRIETANGIVISK